MTPKRPYRVFAVERSLQKKVAKQATDTINAAEAAMRFVPPDSQVAVDAIPVLVEAVNALRKDIAHMQGALSFATTAGESDHPTNQNGDADAQEVSQTELKTMDQDDARLLRREIASMIRSLAAAKREIAEIKHPMGGDDRMKRATLELDAIVGATEEATDQILEATENISLGVDAIRAFSGGRKEVVDATEMIEADVTKIMEACTFQDITGQRITRVVRTFEFIEDRLRKIIETFGVDSFTDISTSSTDMVIHEDDDLVNGPQLEGAALSQDDIDALFG